MEKDDNVKYKVFIKRSISFYSITTKILLGEVNPYEFYLDDSLYFKTLELFEMTSGIDEGGINPEDLRVYYFTVYAVAFNIAMSKLYRNYRCWNGEDGCVAGDEVHSHFLKEEIVSREEILSSIEFFGRAKEYLEKAKTDPIYRSIGLENIYNNLREAYEAIGDESKLLTFLKEASRHFDIRSLKSLSRYYIESENYLCEEIRQIYGLCYEAVYEQTKKQKDLEAVDLNKDLNSAERLLYARAKNSFERLNGMLFSTMIEIVDSLINHSYFEIGLNLATETKERCSQLSTWNLQYANNYKEKMARWSQQKEVNDEVIEPNDAALSDFFSKNTLTMMQPEIKIFIGTSLHVFSCLRGQTRFTLDYSPATISLFKAIERILYKLVITEFYRYLVANKRNYTRIYASNDIYDRENDSFHLPNDFSIGKGLRILVYTRGSRKFLNTGVVDFLKSRGIDDGENKLLKFYNDIESCRLYRNITAHRERVTKQSAEEAREMILETAKIVENAYLDFGSILKK